MIFQEGCRHMLQVKSKLRLPFVDLGTTVKLCGQIALQFAAGTARFAALAQFQQTTTGFSRDKFSNRQGRAIKADGSICMNM